MTPRTPQANARRRAETPAQWLEELGSALRMPYERAEAIRDELAEHLRERVRDLELEGLDEAAAASIAVRELGDAAAVARRFRSAERTPIRRRLMNLAVIGIAGVALVTSFVAISDNDMPKTEASRLLLEQALVAQPEESKLLVEQALARLDSDREKAELARLSLLNFYAVRTSTPARLDPEADSQEPIKVANLDASEMPLGEVFKWLAAQTGLKLHVRWKQFESVGTAMDEPVTIVGGGGDLGSVVAAINDARETLSPTDERRIDYRVKDGVLEFGPQTYFDRRDAFVVRYDIARLLESGIEADDLRGLIQGFVEPDHWVDNGGSLASIRLVGTKMFVKAPPRMQDSVKWYIEQAGDEQHSRAADPAEPAQVVQVYHLKHRSADEVLKSIMKNEQIRAIDFTSFTVDSRRNSIIGRTSAPEHRIVEDAIEAMDVERKPEAAAVRAETNNVVYVSGLVERPGPYNHPGNELTLRRVLISASIKPDAAEATVVRGPADQPLTIGTLRGADLFDPTGLDFVIKPGDIVTVK